MRLVLVSRAALFFLVLAGLSGGAASGNPGPDDLLRPRGLWLGETRDAAVLWGRGYYLLLRAGYSRHALPVVGFPVSDRREEASARLFFAYGLLGGRMDLSAALDVWGSRFTPAQAEGRETPPGTSFGDIGDTRLGLRFALPTLSPRLALSLEGFAVLPTGSPEKGFSADATDGGALMGLTLRWTGIKAHFQTGYRVNRNEAEGVLLYPLFYPKLGDGEGDKDNDALLLRGALEVTSGRVDLFVEFLADRLLGTQVVSSRENLLEAAPGFRLRLKQGLYVSGGAGFNLSRDDPETETLPPPEVLFPDWRVSIGVHWVGILGGTDRDDDGVADGFDQCADDPEDFDGYQDDDGCPDPDNDRDGVLDDWDKAPFDPEDMDGFEDGDGAPDLDNDEDGLPDPEDFCPDEPEDLDGNQDDDGCPDDALPPGGTPTPAQPGVSEKT